MSVFPCRAWPGDAAVCHLALRPADWIPGTRRSCLCLQHLPRGMCPEQLAPELAACRSFSREMSEGVPQGQSGEGLREARGVGKPPSSEEQARLPSAPATPQAPCRTRGSRGKVCDFSLQCSSPLRSLTSAFRGVTCWSDKNLCPRVVYLCSGHTGSHLFYTDSSKWVEF